MSVTHPWMDCRLGDVVTIVKDSERPEEISKSAWVLELEDIEKDSSRLLTRKTAGDRQLRTSRNRFQKDDVLISRLRPNLGKVLLADQEGFSSTEILSLRPKRGLNPRFLFWWLRHPQFRQYSVEASHGLNMPRIGMKALQDAPFRLASTKAQVQTANVLDELVERLGRLRERVQAVPSQLVRYRAAVLNSAVNGTITASWRAVGDEVDQTSPAAEHIPARHTDLEKQPHHDTNTRAEENLVTVRLPDGWQWRRAADLVESDAEIVYGILQVGPNVPDGVPYVKAGDIVDGSFDLEKLSKTTPEIAERYRRATVRPGDILLNIIRSTRVGIVPAQAGPLLITRSTARLRPSSQVSSGYLAIALESPPVQKWLQSHFKGIDMPGLSLGDVRRLPIPTPPPAEQSIIVKRVERLLNHSDELAVLANTVLDKIERCFNAILSAAFNADFVEGATSPEDIAELFQVMQKDSGPSRTGKNNGERRSKMRKTLTIEQLKDTIVSLQADGFAFDELRSSLRDDYELLRDVLFTVLDEENPLIRQMFDSEKQQIQFVRGGK